MILNDNNLYFITKPFTRQSENVGLCPDLRPVVREELFAIKIDSATLKDSCKVWIHLTA